MINGRGSGRDKSKEAEAKKVNSISHQSALLEDKQKSFVINSAASRAQPESVRRSLSTNELTFWRLIQFAAPQNGPSKKSFVSLHWGFHFGRSVAGCPRRPALV